MVYVTSLDLLTGNVLEGTGLRFIMNLQLNSSAYSADYRAHGM